MFDPFGDYDSCGYLRNTEGEKDLEIIKIVEHELFRAQLPLALDYLAQCPYIEYADFLETHRILFSDFYPWAGKDRNALLPDRLVHKGEVYFCHPKDCRRAVTEGLSIAQNKKQISSRPGSVMGLFAYGHPFLDGNGRTMLLVHAELCFRANMSINWMATDKNAYLEALTQEIAHPHSNPLNYYLQPFIGNKICRDQWSRSISSLPGLNGTNIGSDSSAQYSNPEIAESYRIFENKRKKVIGVNRPLLHQSRNHHLILKGCHQ